MKSAKEMDGATICVQPGTSTELAINDYFRLNNMKFTPILIQDLAEIQGAFLSGRCDAYSTDASALATFRFSQGAEGATTSCCCPRSSARSRSASWSARATTSGSTSCAGPSSR